MGLRDFESGFRCSGLRESGSGFRDLGSNGAGTHQQRVVPCIDLRLNRARLGVHGLCMCQAAVQATGDSAFPMWLLVRSRTRPIPCSAMKTEVE